MTTSFDSSTDPDYLWDPSTSPDVVVSAIEQIVRPLGFDPATRPLALPIRAHRTPTMTRVWWTALVAAALLLATTSAVTWRWTWPEGRAWPIRSTSTIGSAPRAQQLIVGEPLSVEAGDVVRVDVARIGSMDVQGESVLTLRATASNRHRLVLTQGTVDLRVWAPPGAVSVRTPAGEVIDLGCVFRVDVDAVGVARVSVETGWVQLDNMFGEILVPAGAASEMHPGDAPLVPVYLEADAAFRDGVRAFEAAIANNTTRVADLSFMQLANRRDVYTLLHLARTAPTDAARAFVARSAELAPPPSTVNITDIVNGERDTLWRWIDSLDLPAPKNWWRNWRDGFGWFR